MGSTEQTIDISFVEFNTYKQRNLIELEDYKYFSQVSNVALSYHLTCLLLLHRNKCRLSFLYQQFRILKCKNDTHKIRLQDCCHRPRKTSLCLLWSERFRWGLRVIHHNNSLLIERCPLVLHLFLTYVSIFLLVHYVENSWSEVHNVSLQVSFRLHFDFWSIGIFNSEWDRVLEG